MKNDTVEVLVRIPKRDFEELQSNYVWWGKHGEYIKKGTVLPKGHGRLIDADKVKENHERWIGYLDEDMITRLNIAVDKHIPTVIEADKDGDTDGNS